MDDLISRKALDREMSTQLVHAGFKSYSEAGQMYLSTKRIVRNAPAVDAAPVVHGRWGEYESFPLTPSLNGCPCSVCKTHFSPSSIIVMKYCPNCGAKMDGGNDND